MKNKYLVVGIVLLIIGTSIMTSYSQITAQDTILFTKHIIDGSFDGAETVYACDVDGDSDIDIIGGAEYDSISWWENDGTESFIRHIIDDGFDHTYSIYACDVDGDTDIDILGTATYADDIVWFENDGAESFTKHIIDENFDNACSVYACDVDGDTDIDVLGASVNDNIIAWWENNGTENFTQHIIDGNFIGPGCVYACDVDGDTDIDVLGVAWIGDVIAWYENDGTETFTQHIIETNFDGPTCIHACDIDGDTDVDVLATSRLNNTIAWWENDGTESFTKHIIDGSLGWANSVFACDVDGDSDIDVLGAGYTYDIIAWYENDGAESFTKHIIDDNFEGAWDVYACDVDGDTDIDVLGASPYDDAIAWWENKNNPVADFSWTPLHPSVNDSIQFMDLSYDSDGTIENWTWNLGDGNMSYEQNPIHQYTSVATFTVTLTVTDDDGATDSISKDVFVCDILVVDAGGPYSGIVGVPITFTGSESGGTPPYSYSWDTSDGIITGNPASHIYNVPGVYDIVLTVTDGTGNTATDITTATILEEPIIVVESITGGLGINAVINNIGTADATDVECKITLTGLVFPKTKTITQDIAVGVPVNLKMLAFGISPITITVTADNATKISTATIILIFVLGVAS